MTAREYNALTDDDRARLLSGLLNTEHIDANATFETLPYWLQHHIAHWVKSPTQDE